MKEILAGELIGIIEEECVPGATLPRAEPEERIAATMASHPRSKTFGKVARAIERALSSFPTFLRYGKEAIVAAPPGQVESPLAHTPRQFIPITLFARVSSILHQVI